MPLSQDLLDELWDFDDAVASEQGMRDAARSLERTREERAELETQLARALGLQGRFAEAEALLDGIGADSPVVSTRILLERGRLKNSAGQAEAAIPLFSRALERASRAGLLFLEVDALHMLAIADGARAAEWARAGLAALERADEDRTRRWAVALHNNLGWSLHDDARLEEALEEFTLAVDAADRFGTADQRFFSRWAVARCLRSLGRMPEALAIQRELAAERPADESVAEELANLSAASGE